MSALFGGGSNASSAPQPKPTAPMPDQDGAATREAQRRRMAAITSRSGRASTILTTPESRGEDYRGTVLG